MFRVIACVTEQHNIGLVVLAALVCVCASVGVFYFLSAAPRRGRARAVWLFLAAVLAGGGTWATHFVAMLGYEPNMAMGFEPITTVFSAIICIGFAWAAFELFERFGFWGRGGAGVLLGMGIAGMHYVGMSGINIAARQVWAFDLVVASTVLSVSFAIAALAVFSRQASPYRLVASASLLIVAICALHFTGMGALTLIPDPTVPVGDHHLLDRNLMAVVVAIGAAAALLSGVMLAFADRQVTATKLAAAEQAAAMALHDALTGLPNRRYLGETLGKRLKQVSHAHPLAVVAIDLDRFKPVSDLYGHAVGDELLVRIARLFQEEAGEGSFVARLGGDEFVILAPYESTDALMGWLSALIAKFEMPMPIAGNEVSVGATLGVALAPMDGVDAEGLMRRADAALYRAKEEGRGRYAFYEHGMDERVQERAALEADLRAAIRNDQIVPLFQPFVSFDSGEALGYEVLSRWTHKTRGEVAPEIFVKLAEETGLIGELTMNVLRRACRETLDWPGRPRISLNVAPLQLKDPALPQKLLKILSECGFPAGRLEIEITENALVADFEAARLILLSLKNLGVVVALDDFGTGYSSLRHLRELPFDELKIDRSFVQSMGESAEALSIVRTIVQLAKNMGLSVTAEGVETEAQAKA